LFIHVYFIVYKIIKSIFKVYLGNIILTNFAISVIIDKAKNYEEIVLPKDGFGTGLSQLPQKAPMTYLYLNKVVRNMILTLLQL